MEICALVLAGGKSTRMNGNNKAFLKYKDRTFIENILEILKEFKKVYISVDDKEKYKNLNYELIEDEYKGIGPISGLYSCLKNMKCEYVFVTACDMPKLRKDFTEFLCSKIDDSYDAVVIKDNSGRFYPLGAIYSKRILPIVKNHIDEENYKMQNLIRCINAKIISLNKIPFKDEVLSNINNINEYEKLKLEFKN